MSSVDGAEILAEHQHHSVSGCGHLRRTGTDHCKYYRLADALERAERERDEALEQAEARGIEAAMASDAVDAVNEDLERAQAASAGVDMLVAQAERRGAVKALRDAAWWRVAASDKLWLNGRANAIERGADL